MIARIEGKLLKIDADAVLVSVGLISYEIMIPAYCAEMLTASLGSEIVLSTIQYYEGSPGGGNLIPRLIGFTDATDKVFFGRFTSVKGMGIRKALRALATPACQIAAAIEQGDQTLLTSLPGIGKKMAQQIVADLKGKMLDLSGPQEAGPASAAIQLEPFQQEALEILVAWGEKRREASELIEKACKNHPEIDTAEQLVPLVYRLKQGLQA